MDAGAGVDAPASVSVVVVAHDSGADLQRCVASVLAQPEALELVVVDNASRDGSLLRLPTDPRVRLLLNPDNRGFARACNQGAELARGALLLFLNPDCELPSGALGALLEAVQAQPGIGVLGAQLLDADGSPQAASHREDPSPWRAVRHAMGLARPGSRSNGRAVASIAGNGNVPRADGTEVSACITDTDTVSGALMLIPRRVFDEVAGFDEGYVLHCEDLDLCRRIRARGHRIAFVPAVRVPHAKGTSSRRRPFWVEWQKHRGMWRYFGKFDAAGTPLPARAVLWLGLWMHFLLAAPRAWLRSRRRT